MAATSNPFVWSFNRALTVMDGANVGGVAHYYDETAQDIFVLSDGMYTRLTTPTDGHWRENDLSTPSQSIEADAYTRLDLDHPSNGVLYGAATDGSSLTFLRYVYAMDISAIVNSWSWRSQIDNSINQFSASIQNIGIEVFSEDVSLFQPGGRIRLYAQLGESTPYPIGTAWIDECSFSINGETVEISGRNTIGYYLKDQTFDENTSFTGISTEIVTNILKAAGITKVSVQPGTTSATVKADPSETFLDGMTRIFSGFAGNSQYDYVVQEMPDGMVVAGFTNWISANHQANSYYSFDEGKDVFSRKTKKAVDGSYTRVRATGVGADGKDLTPVYVTVNNYGYWALGAHRTLHLTAPDGLDQATLQAWTEKQALNLQYVGINEDFSGPFRPQLMVYDVAEVVNDGVGTSLGIITEVTQVFDRNNGFRTEFSIDSGGVYTDGENYTVYSRAAEVSGFNRKQRIIDLVRFVSGK